MDPGRARVRGAWYSRTTVRRIIFWFSERHGSKYQTGSPRDRAPCAADRAEFHDGRWSPAERIATAYTFGWNSETGSVTIDGSGSLHVAARRWVLGSNPQVHDYRLADGQWRDSPLPFTGVNPMPFTGLNETIASLSIGDTMFVAMGDEALDTTRVMVVESADNGAHWEKPVAASPPVIEFVEPPAMVDGFEFTGTPCGSGVMLLRTFSGIPQEFELGLPQGRLGQSPRHLLSRARITTYAGLAASGRGAVAVFGYNDTIDGPWNAAAMALPVC